MVEVVEERAVATTEVGEEEIGISKDHLVSHLLPVSASAPVGTQFLPSRLANPCAESCSVMSRARAVTMRR